MSTSWIIGFIVGLLIAAILVTLIARSARGKTGRKGEYDERQVAARGQAYAAGYFTLLIYLAAWAALRSLELPFFMHSVSVVIGALLSIAVFVGHCIFHDAYFKASESPRAWLAVICATGVVNLVIAVLRLIRETTIEEKLYENMNLYVGALMLVTIGCVFLKRALDRRAEDD